MAKNLLMCLFLHGVLKTHVHTFDAHHWSLLQRFPVVFHTGSRGWPGEMFGGNAHFVFFDS